MTETLGPSLTDFPGAWLLLSIIAIGVGYVAGTLHFRSLEAVASRLLAGEMSAVLLQVGRLAALGGLFWLFALVGAPALIAGAGGVLVARARVLARFRAAP